MRQGHAENMAEKGMGHGGIALQSSDRGAGLILTGTLLPSSHSLLTFALANEIETRA